MECSEIRLRCSSIKDANQSPNYASNESRQIYSIVIGLPSEASLQVESSLSHIYLFDKYFIGTTKLFRSDEI